MSSFWIGAAHPLSGADHLLALIAIGLWATCCGAPFMWGVPLAFILAMSLGAALPHSYLAIPYTGLAASAALVGVLIALRRRIHAGLVIGVVGMVALTQGWAHGLELRLSFVDPGYVFGFMLSTTGLLSVGAALGMLRHTLVPRMAGAGIAGFGAVLLFAG